MSLDCPGPQADRLVPRSQLGQALRDSGQRMGPLDRVAVMVCPAGEGRGELGTL